MSYVDIPIHAQLAFQSYHSGLSTNTKYYLDGVDSHCVSLLLLSFTFCDVRTRSYKTQTETIRITP